MAAVLILLLFLLGLGGVLFCDNLVRKVMALSVLDSAVIILFVWAGSLRGDEAPILLPGVLRIVDPIPQALMLTAIVVGICLTALALAIVLRIYRLKGTVSARRLDQEEAQGDE